MATTDQGDGAWKGPGVVAEAAGLAGAVGEAVLSVT